MCCIRLTTVLMLILLSHAICPQPRPQSPQSLFVQVSASNEEDCEGVYITSSLVQQCHAPGLVAITKFKTMKINFEGLFRLSTKITRHTVVLHVLLAFELC